MGGGRPHPVVSQVPPPVPSTPRGSKHHLQSLAGLPSIGKPQEAQRGTLGELGEAKELGQGAGNSPGVGWRQQWDPEGARPGTFCASPWNCQGLERWAWDFHGSDDSPPPQQTPWIHASFPLAQAWGFQKGLSPCHGDCLPLRLPAQEPVPTLRHLRRGPHSLQRSLPKPRQD